MGILCVLQRMDDVICFLSPALCTWVFVKVDARWRWDVVRMSAPAALTPNQLCPACPLWSALHLVPEFPALESFWPWIFFSICVLRLSAVRSGQNVLMADCPSLTFSSASALCTWGGCAHSVSSQAAWCGVVYHVRWWQIANTGIVIWFSVQRKKLHAVSFLASFLV